jgi:DNA-binding CsgD family transcriptional regulator
VRSAVKRAAQPADRRRAHEVLAEATDPAQDPDRRAWHRAQAAIGPDEGTAQELERSADRAQARGGLAAAAAFAARSAELTPDAPLRATRTLAAAQSAQAAGAHDLSLTLLTAAESGPLDRQQRAQAKLQRAQIAFQIGRNDTAASMLIDAAGGLDGSSAREAYLEAFAAAMYVGRAAPGRLLDVARAALAGPPAPEPPRPLDLLLDGLSANVALGYVEAIPTMQRAVAALSRDTSISTDHLRWLGLACTVAMDLRDDDAHAILADLLVNRARATGALAVLPVGLNYRAGVHIQAGELAEAAALVAEAYAITSATGSAELIYGDLAVSAWRGDEARVDQLTVGGTGGAPVAEGRTKMAMEYATAVLRNGLGEYQTALDAAKAAETHDELGFNAFLPPELVEAAARLGRPDAAAIAIQRLGQRAQACNTQWAIGMDLRSRALLTDGPEAETLYLQAIEALGRTRLAIHVARTRLVYGEWLRRERRPAEAREQLRDAYQTLADMGALAFARRAARELQATGEHPRKRGAHLLDTLTAQELNIAQNAASGATSKEIAATLFLSPRTVDAHLRSIFRKTGVTSRRQLRDLPLTSASREIRRDHTVA